MSVWLSKTTLKRTNHELARGGDRFSLYFLGIPGWERLPRSPDLEQICQALIKAFDGSKKIRSPGGSVGHFMGVQIRGQRLAELGGAADTLVGEQGAHCGGIPLVGLALLQLLKSPG